MNAELGNIASAPIKGMKNIVPKVGKFIEHHGEDIIEGAHSIVGGMHNPKESKDDNMNKISEYAFINELEKIAKKSHFEVLKKNKIPLSDEERKKVMDREAIWHQGPNGAPSPAVWKSVNKATGKTTFVTHTHRAFNTAPTVEGAISRFHKFIKGTA